MKKAHLVALIAIAFPALAFAQSKDVAKPNAETEQAVTKLEKDFSAALVKADAATLASMMTDDCYVVTPDAGISTKTQFLADIKSGDLKFEKNDLSDLKVRAADADMAVVTYISSDKGTYHGQPIDGEARWTDVLVKRDGKWQFAVGQGTAMPHPDKK